MLRLDLRGVDFSGSDGVDRTYTMNIFNLIGSSLDVRLDNNVLIPGVDYEYNSGTDILTIHTYLSDAQYVTIFYEVSSTIVSSGPFYTTAALVEAELRADKPFSTSTFPTLNQLNIWINEISRQIDEISGTKYGSATYTEYFDYEGQDRIQVRNSPIISVTSVEYNDQPLGSSASWSTKTANTDYIVYENSGEILLTPNWSPKNGYKNIRITYTAGYSDIPAKVQMLATKMVAQRVLSSLISSNIHEGNDGGSVSVGSISIVEPASYGVNSYKQLVQDIKDLKQELMTGFIVLRY